MSQRSGDNTLHLTLPLTHLPGPLMNRLGLHGNNFCLPPLVTCCRVMEYVRRREWSLLLACDSTFSGVLLHVIAFGRGNVNHFMKTASSAAVREPVLGPASYPASCPASEPPVFPLTLLLLCLLPRLSLGQHLALTCLLLFSPVSHPASYSTTPYLLTCLCLFPSLSPCLLHSLFPFVFLTLLFPASYSSTYSAF